MPYKARLFGHCLGHVSATQGSPSSQAVALILKLQAVTVTVFLKLMAYKENAAPPCCSFHILHLLALVPNLSQDFAKQPGLLGNLLVCILVVCFSCQMERNQLAKH